jgi:Na+-driven multidrug efflux pump
MIASILMTAFAEIMASPLSALFSAGDNGLFELTKRGFYIYSFAFLFMGFAIYFSSFFTALNDGLTSALISFLRTLVFQVIAVLLLPKFMQTDGIWLSIVVAEIMAVVCSLFFLALKRKKYGYM